MLIEACDGRLSNIQWFRSAWQAGGASTGFAKFTLPDDRTVDAVVKLPVGPTEHRWTTSLGSDGSPCTVTPRTLASGMQVGGHDLAWLVLEKLHGQPLSAHFNLQGVQDLLSAAVDWYAHASSVRPIEPILTPKDWAALIAKGRDVIHQHGIAEEQRWNAAIRQVQRALPDLIARWEARPINTWCHGDLHPGNAMRRESEPASCVLIDLALVHPGHWVEDAVYLERLFWAKPELLHGIKPVSFVAKLRRDRGLPCGEDYSMLAHIRRTLMAASVPAFLTHEGHPKYVHAALEMLEKTLPLVSR
jgi:hypothetical protein